MNVINSLYPFTKGPFGVVFAGFALNITVSQAAPVIVQPTAEDAQDAFVYRFMPSMNFDGAGWNKLLATGKTASGHDVEALLRFDLTGLNLGANETATLNLYVTDTQTAGFGANPSNSAPVVTQLFAATSQWDASSITWNTKPVSSALFGSLTLNGINSWVQFDITDLVRGWIDQPNTNFGVVLAQEAVVTNGGPVMGVFEGSGGANRPFLQIVPEPAMAGALLAGLFLMSRRTRG